MFDRWRSIYLVEWLILLGERVFPTWHRESDRSVSFLACEIVNYGPQHLSIVAVVRPFSGRHAIVLRRNRRLLRDCNVQLRQKRVDIHFASHSAARKTTTTTTIASICQRKKDIQPCSYSQGIVLCHQIIFFTGMGAIRRRSRWDTINRDISILTHRRVFLGIL